MATTNFNSFSTAASINFPEMAIEFNENAVEEVETDINVPPQYDSFLLYARSGNPSDREIAIRDVSRLVQSLVAKREQRQLEVIFSVIENVFAKEADGKLCGMLVEQIPSLCLEFTTLEYLRKKANKLFPEFLASALEHPTDHVRKAAIGAVDAMVEQRLLPQETLQNVICPTLFGHCYCPADYSHYVSDDQRVESVTLLCKIVTTPRVLTRRWIFENFLGRYSILLQDSAFHVRKTCVTILGKLAIMFGKNFTEQFAVPFLMALTEDPIWGVRKSSCEVFVDISNNCTMETKERKLAPRFIALLHDASRWVTNIAFQQLGPFIATFADTNRTGLEIRDGRLVAANSDIAENSETVKSNSSMDEKTMEEDEDGIYNELPPGVVFPACVTDNDLTGAPTLVSSEPQDERYVLNELTCLLDSWALLDGSTLHVPFNYDSNGAAASCSTHSDLTKLMIDDEDGNGRGGNADGDIDDDNDSSNDGQQEDDHDIEVPCPMEIEDDDIEICFEEHFPMNDNDDNISAYYQHRFWSAGYFDVDLSSYGKSTIINYCDGNNKTIMRNDMKERIAEFIQRHSDSLFDIPKYSLNNDIPAINEEYPKCRNDEQTMEEDLEQEIDVISDAMNKTFTIADEMNKPYKMVDSTGHSLLGSNEVEMEESGQSATANVGTQMVIPQALLDSFVQMIAPCDAKEGEINRQCAHSFPAVAFTLGRSNWPCIMDTYKQLASDMQWRVRHTLASSIHEIAAIIGEENADAHLVPVFEQFMKDVEDVKLGLLNHLYDFFKLVTPATRRKLLSVLPNFLHSDTDNGRNWRYRHEYVRQCILLCDLFDTHEINEYLAAIALTLANDRISDVRKEATILLARILGKFVSEEWIRGFNEDSTSTDVSSIPITDSFIGDIVKGFARSVNWRRRQTFALFCERSLEIEALSYEQFSSLLLDDLLRLAGDPVANVRLALARALSKTRGGHCFRNSRDSMTVRHNLEILLSDKDVDCRRAARISLGIPDTESSVDAKNYAQRIRETEEIVSVKYRTDRIMSSDNDKTSETETV